jgi:predicted helicase
MASGLHSRADLPPRSHRPPPDLIPPDRRRYQLGNRCALEWLLDQYKKRKPTDPTIREKFDTYRFKDYKDQVIDLLRRVTTVSVETMRIVDAMKDGHR